MSSRPFGVLVLGALAIAIAVVRLVIGIQLLFGGIFSPRLEGTGVAWAGLLTLVVGAIFLGVGWALMSMRPWALIFTMVMAVLGLVDAMFAMLATGSIAYGIAAAAIPAFLLWYCSREDVRAAFSDPARPGQTSTPPST
jgi:hypothetical protein